METTYKSDPKMKVPCILWEFFRPLQRLTELELYQVAEYILLETQRGMPLHPKIFLKHPRHIKEWCEFRKRKTMVVRELSNKVLWKQLVNLDGKIIWENWRSFKVECNINGTSMTALVKEANPFLASRATKNEKKPKVDNRECFVLSLLGKQEECKMQWLCKVLHRWS